MRKTTMLAGALGIGLLATAGITAVAVASPGGPARMTAVQLAADGTKTATNTRYESNSRHTKAHVDLKDAHGKRIAQVDIVALNRGGNLVTVHAWNLTPGFHAIHIHAAGVCDPAGTKPFASAGGHFNPTGKPEGMQAGAFPVLLAGPNGEAQTQFTDGNFMLRDLFGPAGTAIVIHVAADNYANIPPRYSAGGVTGPDTETQMTGDAGTRIACGVVSPPSATPTPSPTKSMARMPGM